MHKNPAWLTFLAIVAAATVWFCVSAILAVQLYHAQSTQAPVLASNWSYEEVASDTYTPRVRYHFRLGEQIVEGEMQMKHPIARNPAAAEDMVDSLAEQRWWVWYDPSHPKSSTLQKSLPIQECLSALTLMGVFVYLLWLGYSVGLARS